MKTLIDRLYGLFKSVKLAAVLILLLAAMSIAGSINPTSGVTGVFSSVPFMATVALFVVNLTVCTVHRLSGQFRKSLPERRHGPDLLHIGLLVLAFGGTMTARMRTEEFFFLGKGEAASLPDGMQLFVSDLTEATYEDGRPRSWETVVVIGTPPESEDYDTLGETGYMNAESNFRRPAQAEQPEGPETPIRVNSPLRHGPYRVFQQSWKTRSLAIVGDKDGQQHALMPGERFLDGYESILFMSAAAEKNPLGPDKDTAEDCDDHKALFVVGTDTHAGVKEIAKGGNIGSFTFAGFRDEPLTGLKIVKDPGYPVVLTGLVLSVIGVFLTYIQKMKGMFT